MLCLSDTQSREWTIMAEWKIGLAGGLAALAVAGGAVADEVRIRIDRGGPGLVLMERFGEIDANTDGFISRDEAKAQAERVFEARDEDKDGKIEARSAASRREGARRRRAEARHGEAPHREVRREVFIIRDGEEGEGEEVREIRLPPRPPGPPAMMLFFSSGEADLNGDGALSKQEFVDQQLRFFDAADANRDGRIEAPTFPEPPHAPDAPPAPPRP